jgi:hypothetical protein
VDESTARPDWSILLRGAIDDPGRLSTAYQAFYTYSLGNQLLALEQCLRRDLPIGPLASYRGWQARGRQVTKGQKALCLWMPIHARGTPKPTDEEAEARRVRFVFVNRWFVHAQTEPADGAAAWVAPPVPGWDRARALAALRVTEVAFDHLNGNLQGWSVPADRTLALNPLAAHPAQTTFHELAHIVLGHAAGHDDRGSQEVEAECVNLLATATLDPAAVAALAEARGYVQWWLARAEGGLTDEMARRIMAAATQLLAAGRPPQAPSDAEAAA